MNTILAYSFRMQEVFETRDSFFWLWRSCKPPLDCTQKSLHLQFGCHHLLFWFCALACVLQFMSHWLVWLLQCLPCMSCRFLSRCCLYGLYGVQVAQHLIQPLKSQTNMTKLQTRRPKLYTRRPKWHARRTKLHTRSLNFMLGCPKCIPKDPNYILETHSICRKAKIWISNGSTMKLHSQCSKILENI